MGKPDDLYEYQPKITAQGRLDADLAAFNHEYRDPLITKPRKRALAFCLNYRCGFSHGPKNLQFTRHGTNYDMANGAIAYMITKDRGIDFCPYCDYALFWSSEYIQERKSKNNQKVPKTGQQRSRKAYG
jgi:hypothetical protein